MVGVPRSRGCSVCVKRRVKCDETRPGCTKCSTYGVSCPGYERALKFVDRVHRRRQVSCTSREISTRDGTKETSPAVQSASAAPNMAMVPFHREPGEEITTVCSPSIYQVQCMSTWIEDTSWSKSSSPDEATIARLFGFIPARLGTSVALDLAVHCLTVNHLGIAQGSEDIVRCGWYAYGKALHSLQRAIYDPVEAIKSETICATMILSIYELFACTKADSWMAHANGVSKLMRLRGPKSFQSDFDSAMLTAFKGMIVMEALFSGKPCFLELDEWRCITPQHQVDSFTARMYEKTEGLGAAFTSCPWLVGELYKLREASLSDVSTLVRVSALVTRAFEIYGRLQVWYGDFITFASPPEEIPSPTKDELYPMTYHYSDPTIATIFCGYYAMIMIVQGILAEFHHPARDTEQISLMVDNVCKSIEYFAGTGILGPYRVGFSMRVAFDVGSVTTKLWIRKWLIHFEKFYKACSPSNYPPIEIADTETPVPL